MQLLTDLLQALLIPSWLFGIGFTALSVDAIHRGVISRHIWDVVPSAFEGEALNVWLASFIFLLGSACLKVSVLLFYRRIQSATYGRRWMFAIYGAIWFTVAYTVALIFALIFNCRPTQAYWKAYDPKWTYNYKCSETGKLNLLAGILSVVSDLYAVVLPCLMLQRLHISRRQKIGLNAVFAISLVSAGAGAGRTYTFNELSKNYDITW